MPLLNTSGNVTADAYGGGVAAVPKYIEEYFSTFLYSGTGSAQTITNGIDLSTKGGLVWIKDRTQAYDHGLFDTSRGAGYRIISNSTAAENYSLNYVSSFNNNGFSIGSPSSSTNTNGDNYVSWTIAKAPKFFDVVTYTGDGTSPRAISHNLGSAPGCVIIKQTNAVNDWCVWHTATGNDKSAALNTTAAFATFAQRIKSVTSTTFTVGNSSTVNDSGATYVAYLFAHNAGGFGLTGTDNVISCGSFTTDGSGVASVTLGYEPQFLLQKPTSTTGNWFIADNMRGMPVGANATLLRPNLSDAESAGGVMSPTATGFSVSGFQVSQTYIYIAIRRGPMKVPTSGTSVFSPVAYTGNNSTTRPITSGFTPDTVFREYRNDAQVRGVFDRLRGASSTSAARLDTTATSAEVTGNAQCDMSSVMDGILSGTALLYNSSPDTYVNYFFSRAPSFFDEVCYTGTGSALTVKHNLGVVPELVITKNRSGADAWFTTHKDLTNPNTYVVLLNTNQAQFLESASGVIYDRTSTEFKVGAAFANSGATYVAYLFATCAGVSKVGSYTGTGATQTISCGFTGGARFVLIKRTDSTGNWGVLDTARGMVSGTDPYLNLNTTAAEVNANNVYTTTGGFQLVSSDANFNANGGTYIFLAIA